MPIVAALLFAGLLVEAPPAIAPQETIIELEQRFADALLRRDGVVVGDLLADDLVHIGFEGQIVGKGEYMEFFKHGAWRYQQYTLDKLSVKPLGAVAVATGRVLRVIVVNDQETRGSFAFTHVWSQVENQWRMTSSQASTIPALAPE